MLRKLLFVAIQAAVMTVVTVGLLEGLVAVSFWRPTLSPLPAALLQYLYVNVDRNTIQVMPTCARYDADVTYTLRPGGCTFSNREFSNQYHVNSLGLRDDEASLERPEIVVLGDSLAMGWGVDQDESFPERLEQRLGRRVLNAGVSSYGTVRELRTLQRIDRSALRQLVIQYSDNDFLENEQFVTSPTLRILSEADYQRTVADHAHERRYYPGKYALNLVAQFRATLRRQTGTDAPQTAQAGQQSSWSRHADLFVAVLERSPVPLDGVRIGVLTLDDGFAVALRERLAAISAPWLNSVTVLDVSSVRRIDGAFYVLDDHPRSSGQAAIAEVVWQWLNAGQS